MGHQTHFPFTIEIWCSDDSGIERHVAGVDDFETAVATYWAARRRWPKARMTLRQGIRIVEKSWAEDG